MTDRPTAVDPFDLPDWLGVADVTWTARAGLRTGYAVAGQLDADGEASLPCDLLAVDDAYPAPVASDGVRLASHQAWRHGEVHLVERGGRLTLAVPGTSFSADRVLDAVGRLARAVGASAERYSVRLRIGDARTTLRP
ncbi:hypothetical protein [Nocardioides sp. YIM 152315]|uniref:hypothetical protein n=1 Tax=Nocardioides sp. YIM 152315 TaxID=3031760 RepID=UPI0023DCDF90|nr:hypothetical protein [Nocardioides sp. YIM 152315]MDF1602465.1 hypothetical protein [Nocardioides sp. YIM 152315]